MKNRINRTIKITALTIIILLSTTGCWDRVEINERAYITIAAIDIYDPEKSDTKPENRPPKNDENRYKITYAMPDFEAIKEGGTGKDAMIRMTTVTENPTEATRNFRSRMDSRPFFQHMKAVVFGVDVLKNPQFFMESLDTIERENQISKKLHIYISEDQASDILELDSPIKPLDKMLQNISHVGRERANYVPRTIEEVIDEIGNGASTIPRVKVSETEIKVKGSAVIKDREFIGWLEERETKAFSYLIGEVKTGIVQVEHENTNIVYRIKSSSTDKNVKVEDGKLKAEFIIKTEGTIDQYKIRQGSKLIETELIRKLEKLSEEDLEKSFKETVDIIQNELNADIIGISTYLKKYKPDVWKQVGDDWDTIFPQVEIDVKVECRIRTMGPIR